jgi:hypothetical protein
VTLSRVNDGSGERIKIVGRIAGEKTVGSNVIVSPGKALRIAWRSVPGFASSPALSTVRVADLATGGTGAKSSARRMHMLAARDNGKRFIEFAPVLIVDLLLCVLLALAIPP